MISNKIELNISHTNDSIDNLVVHP